VVYLLHCSNICKIQGKSRTRNQMIIPARLSSIRKVPESAKKVPSNMWYIWIVQILMVDICTYEITDVTSPCVAVLTCACSSLHPRQKLHPTTGKLSTPIFSESLILSRSPRHLLPFAVLRWCSKSPSLLPNALPQPHDKPSAFVPPQMKVFSLCCACSCRVLSPCCAKVRSHPETVQEYGFSPV
jgi:hypothetical protein